LWCVVATFAHFFIFLTIFFIKKLSDQLLLQLPQSSPTAFLVFIRFNLLHIPCLRLHLNLSCLHTLSNNKLRWNSKRFQKPFILSFTPPFILQVYVWVK
jgi:hypothetical protein